MNHATPAAGVSAFCRAVLSNLIPHGFWGDGDTRVHNELVFFHNVTQFVELRRFESLTLHKVLQKMKVSETLPSLYKAVLTMPPDHAYQVAGTVNFSHKSLADGFQQEIRDLP